jgi:hypothetical protein
VDASLPVDAEEDCSRLGVHIDDNLLNQGTDNALLQADIGLWSMPQRFQLCRKSLKIFYGRRRALGLLACVLLKALLKRMDVLSRVIPPSLQFVDHETVLGL